MIRAAIDSARRRWYNLGMYRTAAIPIPAKRRRAYYDSRGGRAVTVKRAVGLLPFVLGAVAAALAVPFAI